MSGYEEERRASFVSTSSVAAFTVAVARCAPAVADLLMHPKLTDDDRHAIIEAAIAAAINAVMIESMRRQGVPQELIDKASVSVVSISKPKGGGT